MEKYRSVWENKLVSCIIEHQLKRWETGPRTKELADEINDRIAGAWKSMQILRDDLHLRDQYNHVTRICPVRSIHPKMGFLDGPVHDPGTPPEECYVYFNMSEERSNQRIDHWVPEVQSRIDFHNKELKKLVESCRCDRHTVESMRLCNEKIQKYIEVLQDVLRQRHTMCPISVGICDFALGQDAHL